jgi:uncharacterized protein YdeI (YjbR/CyaY-like superfamily)
MQKLLYEVICIMAKFAYGDGMPMGLGMALAQNEAAMLRFSGLTDEQRAQVLSGIHEISSSEEMKGYVQRFAEGQIL